MVSVQPERNIQLFPVHGKLHALSVASNVEVVRYRISGNFHVIKSSREKNSQSKIFAVWAFHENLTRGENMEEYGRDWCIRGCHVYHEIWEQLLEQLHYDGRRTCQFRPEQPDYTACMAHVSH